MVMHPDKRGVAIANLGHCFGPSEGFHDADTAERNANARLIAAAPDLLDALLRIANRDLTYVDGSVCGGIISAEDILFARGAIEKATGGAK